MYRSQKKEPGMPTGTMITVAIINALMWIVVTWILGNAAVDVAGIICK